MGKARTVCGSAQDAECNAGHGGEDSNSGSVTVESSKLGLGEAKDQTIDKLRYTYAMLLYVQKTG